MECVHGRLYHGMGIPVSATLFIIFDTDPNLERGTVCRIGDSWFYFGGLEAEEMEPEEYLNNIPMGDIVREIYEVLEEFREDEELVDEYAYYGAVLTYRNGCS